jgi:hypothetical protein
MQLQWLERALSLTTTTLEQVLGCREKLSEVAMTYSEKEKRGFDHEQI